MFSLLVVILTSAYGNGLIMPMTNPDGSLDVSSLLSHIALMEQTIESKSSAVETADLKTQLKTALTDLTTAQADLRTTRSELSEVKSDLKATQTELAVVQFQLKSSNTQCPCNATTVTQPSEITSLKADVSTLKTDVFQLQSLRNSSGGSATFVRWGRTVCPSGNKMIYKGFTGGTSWDAKASSATMLCLPEHPLYANHTQGAHYAYIYGTEYQTDWSDDLLHHLNNQDMPCVVCESDSRRSAIMVPARNQCYPGWNLEYWGYIMGAENNHASAEFICVDKDPEAVPGGGENKDGQTLYVVEGICGSLPCPPYVNNWELTCSVCTQ